MATTSLMMAMVVVVGSVNSTSVVFLFVRSPFGCGLDVCVFRALRRVCFRTQVYMLCMLPHTASECHACAQANIIKFIVSRAHALFRRRRVDGAHKNPFLAHKRAKCVVVVHSIIHACMNEAKCGAERGRWGRSARCISSVLGRSANRI